MPTTTAPKGGHDVPETLGQRLKEWRDRNPLRMWRNANDISMRTAAGLLGRSPSTIQSWEYGATDPDIPWLAEKLNIKPTAFQRRWNAWLADKPLAEQSAA